MSLIDKEGLRTALSGINSVLYTKEDRITVDAELSDTSENPVQTAAVSKAVSKLDSRISTVEKSGTNLPNVFISGDMTNMTKENKVIMKMEYTSGTVNFSGYADMKWQGSSSLAYPKKNFSFTIYEDADKTITMPIDLRWGAQSKYVLKANYIDASHARNIVSARLWSDIVASRSDYDAMPEELKNSPNNGAINGYPVYVYINGVYQGLYTWNIPKDAWAFGMNSKSNQHAAMCSEDYPNGCFTQPWSGVNGDGWTDELRDNIPANIKSSWQNAINFVVGAIDGTLQPPSDITTEEAYMIWIKNQLENYFNLNSLIDYYIYGMASCGLDSRGKNQIYLTYDETIWYASMYDMDSTWGLYWDGSKFVSSSYIDYEDFINTTAGYGNSLYFIIDQLFWPEYEARYAELRQGPLSLANINKHFNEFINLIPTEAYNEDNWIWEFTLGEENNIYQLRQYIYDRILFCDDMFDYTADDTNVAPAGDNYGEPEKYLKLSGGRMWGKLYVNEPTESDEAANKFYVDNQILENAYVLPSASATALGGLYFIEDEEA